MVVVLTSDGGGFVRWWWLDNVGWMVGSMFSCGAFASSMGQWEMVGFAFCFNRSLPPTSIDLCCSIDP